MLTLVISVYGRWKLSIGDPTIADWVMTAMYIATALLCWSYARNPEILRGHRAFWRSLAAGLLVLGINKQLDLHVLLEAICREVAEKHGWYPQRRTVQMWFVTGLTAASLALVIFTGFVVRRASRKLLLAFCGMVLLIAFVVLRAASIHHIFEMLKLKLPGTWLLTILQGSGILCIGLSAVLGVINCHKRTTHHYHFPPHCRS